MTTADVYLKFTDDGEVEHLVSVDSILEGGYPIDPESGDDMTLVSNVILNDRGNRIATGLRQ